MKMLTKADIEYRKQLVNQLVVARDICRATQTGDRPLVELGDAISQLDREIHYLEEDIAEINAALFQTEQESRT